MGLSQIKVELIDYMGDDDSVVRAARVSFAKDAYNYTPSQNSRLIEYLAREKHEIPFAHTAATFRVSAPLVQRTHCFKSKIGLVENEESRRYISSRPEIYIPDEWRTAANDKKQGSGGVHPESNIWKEIYLDSCAWAIATYNVMVAEGVAPEMARYILPQGAMVNWIWTGSLLAFARFYNLRSKPDTQLETQQVAQEIGLHMSRLWPKSWDALTNAKRLEAVTE